MESGSVGAPADAAMVRALAAHPGSPAFEHVEVRWDGSSAALYCFRIARDRTLYGVRIPLPSSACIKPWLYAFPDDSADSVRMLASFLDEEVLTGCRTWAVSTVVDDVTVFELAPYGFRSRDDHERLGAAAGPGGWHGDIQESDDFA